MLLAPVGKESRAFEGALPPVPKSSRIRLLLAPLAVTAVASAPLCTADVRLILGLDVQSAAAPNVKVPSDRIPAPYTVSGPAGATRVSRALFNCASVETVAPEKSLTSAAAAATVGAAALVPV